MPKVVKRASMRASQLNYAKRRVKVPTLAAPPYQPPAMGPMDYSKLSPLSIGGGEGPLVLKQPRKPKRPRL